MKSYNGRKNVAIIDCDTCSLRYLRRESATEKIAAEETESGTGN